MLTVSRLRRKPRHFHCFTGLTPAEFDSLLSEVVPVYEGTEQHKVTMRLRLPNRLRKEGAGRPFVLPLPERLLMGLIYLRLYTGQSVLSFLFDVDQSTVCRELSRRLLPILLTVLPVPLRDAPLRADTDKADTDKKEEPTHPTHPTHPKRRRINTLDELLRTNYCERIPNSLRFFWMPPSSPFRNPRINENANWPSAARSKTTR